MLKKLLLLCLACFLTMSTAYAASVDVNTADQTTLESLKGLGPVKSKAIIDERTQNGPFKNADDLASRVKGLGTKSVAKLESEGLMVGGSSAPPTGAKSANHAMGAAASAPAAKASSKSAAPSAMAMASTSTAASAPIAASAGKASRRHKKDKAASAAATSGG
jgi:competence ComEA-like helix-hairpin-helix protein